MDLSGFRKVYVSKKKVRIVYEIQDDILNMEVYKKAFDRL